MKARSRFHEICTRTVKCYGIERRSNAEVRDDGRIIVVPAVAVRRNVHDETDMERRLSVDHCICIFRNLAVEDFGCVVILHDGSGLLTYGNALAAAHALVIIYDSLPVNDLHGIMTAIFLTDPAADAVIRIDTWL